MAKHGFQEGEGLTYFLHSHLCNEFLHLQNQNQNQADCRSLAVTAGGREEVEGVEVPCFLCHCHQHH